MTALTGMTFIPLSVCDSLTSTSNKKYFFKNFSKFLNKSFLITTCTVMSVNKRVKVSVIFQCSTDRSSRGTTKQSSKN